MIHDYVTNSGKNERVRTFQPVRGVFVLVLGLNIIYGGHLKVEDFRGVLVESTNRQTCRGRRGSIGGEKGNGLEGYRRRE